MLMFLDNKWEMKRSDIPRCRCSSDAILSLAMKRIVVGVMAVALPVRRSCPARQPSPKNSPGPSVATSATWPARETADSLTPPVRM